MKASHPHYNFWLQTALVTDETEDWKFDKFKYLETEVSDSEDLELLKANNTSLESLLRGTTQLEADFPALQKMAERHNEVLGFKFWYPELITKEDYRLCQKKKIG